MTSSGDQKSTTQKQLLDARRTRMDSYLKASEATTLALSKSIGISDWAIQEFSKRIDTHKLSTSQSPQFWRLLQLISEDPTFETNDAKMLDLQSQCVDKLCLGELLQGFQMSFLVNRLLAANEATGFDMGPADELIDLALKIGNPESQDFCLTLKQCDADIKLYEAEAKQFSSDKETLNRNLFVKFVESRKARAEKLQKAEDEKRKQAEAAERKRQIESVMKHLPPVDTTYSSMMLNRVLCEAKQASNKCWYSDCQGGGGKLAKCGGGCKVLARYCCKACQEHDWVRHKHEHKNGLDGV